MKKLVARELLLMFPAKVLKQIPKCLFVWKPWSTDFRHFQTVFASIEGEPHCPSTALYSYSIIACVERRMGTKLQTVCRIKSLKHNTVTTLKNTKMPPNAQVNHCELCFPQVQLVYQALRGKT
jgi:hypothetical protein